MATEALRYTECERKAKSFNSLWKRIPAMAMNTSVLFIAPAKSFCGLLRVSSPKAQAILDFAKMPSCDAYHYILYSLMNKMHDF
jgi:hypothetical protein